MTNKLKCPFCNGELERVYSRPFQLICGKCGSLGTDELWQELIRTRKALEQSEICCAEWEKQALDYKAENIALSGDLERTRKALSIAVDALNEITNNDYDADWQNDLAQATLEKIKDIK